MSWSRRHVLKVALAAGAAVALDAGARGTAALHAGHGDSPPPGPATVKAAQVTAVLSAAHFVAQFGGHFRKEGVSVELVDSAGGMRSVQMIAAANQAHYMLGELDHAQRLTDLGKPAVILFVTDRKSPAANLVVRKDAYEAGLTSIDKLATMKPVGGGKWKAGAPGIGSTPWMYGSFVLRAHSAGGGRTLDDMVDWIGVGQHKASLEALRTGMVDLVAAGPELIVEAESRGIGRVLFDVRDDRQWLSVFNSPLPTTAAYGLKSTVAMLRDETQAYVTAVYKATQWMKAAATTEIARLLGRYEDAMGLSRASLIKVIDWYKAVWTYDLALTRADYENGIRVARTIKAERAFPYEQMVDLSFLRSGSGKA